MIRLLRRVVPPLLYGLVGCLAAVIVAYGYWLNSRPDLMPWHEARLDAEFRAEDAEAVRDLDGYRRLEDRLFAELKTEVNDHVAPEDRVVANRYWSLSPLNPERFPTNWNQTFELAPVEPVAGVLLLHGLSDSPYSMRALGELLQGQGLHVVGLRLPGHGTAPSGLLDVTAEDWRAAVRLAAKHLQVKVGQGRPVFIAGYSNGAALAVDHALAALEGEDVQKPAGLILVSPALQVTPAAAFARYLVGLSRLIGLEKLAWTDLQPEFDPYKYNSFTVNAGAQIHALTASIAARIERLGNGAPVAGFPPVLAFQSAVDATIPSGAVIAGLLRHLATDGSHELVVFDVNHATEAQSLLRPEPGTLAGRLLEENDNPFAVAVVTNGDDVTRSVVARLRAAGGATIAAAPLPLAWPERVFSLSHVALPFPPDDPIYGGPEGSLANPAGITLGGITLLGERGILQVPDGFFLRLRYNPFFAYVEERVRGFVSARLQGRPAGAVLGSSPP